MEINSDLFSWEYAGIRYGYHVFDFIKQDNGKTIRINKNKYKLIGYCDSLKLSIRPGTNQIAVLFEINDDNEILDKVWIHFPRQFKKLFKK